MGKVRDFVSLEVKKQELNTILSDVRDWKVFRSQTLIEMKLKEKVVPVLYRPFDIRYTYT